MSQSFETCDQCSGTGSVAVHHNAWISEGKVKGEDVMGACRECNGEGKIEYNNFIKSDYCNECGGEGYYQVKTHETEEYVEYEKEQCPECEHLHEMEVRADRMHDEAKGN